MDFYFIIHIVGMVSSGLSGLAAVMVEMTVPGQRRMALTPTSCPITDHIDPKKGVSKSASTLSSEMASGEIPKESPMQERKKKKKGYFDYRKSWRKSMTDQPIHDKNKNDRSCFRLASSPNLSTLEDRAASDVMRTRLTPEDAIVPVDIDGTIDGANLFSNYDKAMQSSDQESLNSVEKLDFHNKQKSKRRDKEKLKAKLSLSDRNIPSMIRNGSITSPFLKRIVSIGKSKSNKVLERTSSIDHDRLLKTYDAENPQSAISLPRQDSAINILITDVDSDQEINKNGTIDDKFISNGQNKRKRVRRSISLLQSPFHESAQ